MRTNMMLTAHKHTKRKSPGIYRLDRRQDEMAVPFTEVFSWM